jgi:hypothetical protein
MTGSIAAASFFTIKFGGKNLKELANMTISSCGDWNMNRKII